MACSPAARYRSARVKSRHVPGPNTGVSGTSAAAVCAAAAACEASSSDSTTGSRSGGIRLVSGAPGHAGRATPPSRLTATLTSASVTNSVGTGVTTTASTRRWSPRRDGLCRPGTVMAETSASASGPSVITAVPQPARSAATTVNGMSRSSNVASSTVAVRGPLELGDAVRATPPEDQLHRLGAEVLAHEPVDPLRVVAQRHPGADPRPDAAPGHGVHDVPRLLEAPQHPDVGPALGAAGTEGETHRGSREMSTDASRVVVLADHHPAVAVGQQLGQVRAVGRYRGRGRAPVRRRRCPPVRRPANPSRRAHGAPASWPRPRPRSPSAPLPTLRPVSGVPSPVPTASRCARPAGGWRWWPGWPAARGTGPRPGGTRRGTAPAQAGHVGHQGRRPRLPRQERDLAHDVAGALPAQRRAPRPVEHPQHPALDDVQAVAEVTGVAQHLPGCELDGAQLRAQLPAGRPVEPVEQRAAQLPAQCCWPSSENSICTSYTPSSRSLRRSYPSPRPEDLHHPEVPHQHVGGQAADARASGRTRPCGRAGPWPGRCPANRAPPCRPPPRAAREDRRSSCWWPRCARTRPWPTTAANAISSW